MDFKEEWKDIQGYEGLYKISNTGKVWSVRPNKEMKCTVDHKTGYNKVCFYVKGKGKTFRIHKLVAFHFVSGYAEGLVVNHKVLDKLNNFYNNLEWVTQKYNINHAVTNGAFKNVGVSTGKGEISEALYKSSQKRKKPIVLIHPDGKEEAFGSSSEACKKYNLHDGHLSGVINGKLRSTKGFTARFLEV